jgi:DNA-binding FadR family transcriptional regulator
VAGYARTLAAEPAKKFEFIERKHAADGIYDQLAVAILRGDFAVGSALPPERELAEQFGVSRNIARQAVHRIAELGLVRVRQGGATIVQDSSQSTDVRLLALRFRVNPRTDAQKREFVERRMLEGFALVQLASHHATNEELAAIHAIIDEYAARGAPEEENAAFELKFWTAMAGATHNQFYIGQLAFWNHLIAQRGRESTDSSVPAVTRLLFYRELLRRLMDGLDAPQFYLDTLRPLVLGSPPKR